MKTRSPFSASPAAAACLVLCASVFPGAGAGARPAVQRVRNGVQLAAGGVNERVQFYADRTVRVVKWPAGGKPDKASLVVIQKDVPELNVRIEETAGEISLSLGPLGLRVSKSDGAIRYLDGGNRALFEERGAAVFTPCGIEAEKAAFSVRQNFHLTPEEGIYGFGEQQSGQVNTRGRTVNLVQSNTESVTPFFVSTAGYGVYWDNYSKTVFADNPAATSLWSEVADNIDYYFFFGPSLDQVIAGYRQLTGQAPMYGKWAFGYWQSKEHYASRDELLAVSQEFRDRKIPIDSLVQDWQYWGGNDMWSGMVFDEKTYPRAQEMIDILHQRNFHLMVSIWGGLGPASAIYQDMERRGFLYPMAGWAGFKYFDAYNPAAADLYWQYANRGLFSKGVNAWWMDSTEPDIATSLTKDAEEYWMKKAGSNYLGSFARYLNTYPLVDTEAIYRNQRKETSGKRVYILTRSAFAGQQRAAATTWSGDIGANWDIYRNQISAGINHSMSGIPYWTLDIGAFMIGAQGGVFTNGGEDPAYRELYTRMFQFGAFCPIFRSHGSDTPREPWQFGEYTPVLVKFDDLRYRLLPYIYSLGWRVTHDGYSIMRGLPMDFPADRKTYSIGDQFMFGPAIMAAPVTAYMDHRPMESAIPVAPASFRTKDGKPGLAVKYYCDAEFKKLCHEDVEPGVNLDWYSGWPAFIPDYSFSMRFEGKLIPPQTGKYRFDMKAFGPKRLYLDGKEVPHNFDSVESYTVPVNLESGKEYDFAFETSNSANGAFRAILFWKTPEIHAREAAPAEPRPRTRSVYLPAGSRWVDFWTGQALAGGAAIAANADIGTMPLMIRAGSILPMGPFLQYATEKRADPLELRIYPGADGSFTLYEDENDNYNYEKGVYATIGFHWDDAKRQLKIDAREGTFPGMLRSRTFHVTVVGKDHGAGLDVTEHPDKTVQYSGQAVALQL